MTFGGSGGILSQQEAAKIDGNTVQMMSSGLFYKNLEMSRGDGDVEMAGSGDMLVKLVRMLRDAETTNTEDRDSTWRRWTTSG